MVEGCPFCEIDRERLWLDNEVGFALWDAYPVSEGHALVVPRRHVASIYDLPGQDQHSLWELVAEARQALIEILAPMVSI
jgi:diadenosine tetraphosphate (Ap4A) HIT family hydrolase